MCSAKKFVSFLLGFGWGSFLFVLVTVHLGFYETKCPTVLGRECNHQGICGKHGKCQCEPQFSGRACEYTACPGYNPETGTVCHGRGLCSPLMTTSHPHCMLGGWNSPGCVAFLEQARVSYSEGVYVSTFPTCLCHTPYGGLSCEFNLCPLSADFQVCSGNGNKSVGLVRNDTGEGCQCQNYASLYDVVSILPRQSLARVHDKYLHDFKVGFCGTPVVVGDSLVIAQNVGDIRCYCDERHYGISCQYGVCPDINGKTCGGHGHAKLGFGVELHAPKRMHSECVPNCAPGKVLRNGICAHSSPTCPSDRPYRCPSLDCVASR